MNNDSIKELIDSEISRAPVLCEDFFREYLEGMRSAPMDCHDCFGGDVLKTYKFDMQRFLAKQSVHLKSMGFNHTIIGDFIDSSEINAFGMTAGNISFIGINVGVWVKLNLIFGILSKGLEIDADANDVESAAEKFDEYKKNYGELAVSILESEDMAYLREIKNHYRDLAFNQFACNAARMCLEYILAHEYFHIALGHTKFLNEYHRDYMLNEAEQKGASWNQEYFPNIDFHSLELEADCYSAIGMARAFQQGRMMFGKLAMDDEQFVVHLSFSLSVLFALLDISGSKISDCNSIKHPHPDLRMLMISYALMDASPKILENESMWNSCHEFALELLLMLGMNMPLFRKMESENYRSDKLDKILELYQSSNTKMFCKTKKYRMGT